MAFDPIPTSFDLDDPKNPQGDFGPGARKISNELGKAQQADPLKEGIAVRTQRKADLSRTKQALDQLEGTFLSTDGAGLFALNEKGKPFKNPDGTYVPDLGAKVENLRARATGQVGAIRGALFPGVSRGDPTGDALAAQAELSNIEPVYEAKRQKWERIQEQRNRWKEAHDQNELELGALSAQRLARDGLLYAPQQPAPMGQSAPAPTPMQPSEPSAVPAAAAPAQDPTFLSEVGTNATDLVASFGSGSNALLKMAGDLYGLASGDFNNWLSEQGKYGMDYFERMKSPEMLAKQQARKAAIDAAPDELGKALEFVRSTISDPMLLASSVTEQLPNTVGAGGVGAVVRKGAEKLLLRKAATEAAKQIAERQALKAGVGAAVGAGAVMQGADVGGDQYGEVLVQMERMTKPQLEKIPEIAELLKRGASIDEAKTAYALTQARKTGLVAGAVSVGAQMLPGARVIEKTLAGGSAARSTMGRLAAGAAGLVAEGASEAIEEGGGRVAQNVFAQGVDPERKLTAGVGETVGQAVVTGGIMGGAAGVVNGGEQEETTNNQPPPPAQPPVAPAPAQPGPAAPQAPQAQAPTSVATEDEGPVSVDPELQAELDAETQQPATPAPVSTQGGPDAQAGLIRQSSVGSTPTPAPTSQPPVSPWKVSSPEVKSAWMEGPPADDTKMQQIRDSFTQPGVKLGYSVFDGAPGRPRALQIDAIDANGESMVSSNIYDLARAGIEVPIPPASLKPGTYSREQIEQALGSQAPTTTETSADVTQSPQSGIAGNETETTEAKPKYEKSSTQVTLPEEQAKPFRDFGASIPDEDIYEDPENPRFGRETEPHITALYGIENDDVDAVKSALAGVGPIKAMLGEVTSFENADKPYDVLKVDVNSPALRKVNEAIKQGTKNSSDFPDYKPHLTIGYVKKGMAKKYVGDDRFAGNTFTFNSLQFRTRDGRSIDIPLTGSTTSAQTTTQAPGSGEGITNGQMPQGSATPTGAGTLPSNGQSQKVPTEAEGQVGGQQPAPGVRPGAGKGANATGFASSPGGGEVRSTTQNGSTTLQDVGKGPVRGPAIARGSNTPARFAQVATQAAGLKSSDTGSKFLRDFAPRLQKANAKAFADMEVNVLTDAEWKAHPSLSKSNPDSPAAFNVDRNILHLNADKLKGGQKIAEAIVHEAGHFAEFFALGEEFTQQQWESLTDEQRQDAAKSYDWKDERSGAELKADRRARAEWVAMQFTRVVTGDTTSMEPTIRQKLEEWLQVVREVVQQWLGNKRYTTAELDAKILELIGYKAPPSAEGNQSPQPGESAPTDAAKDGQATQQGSGTTNVPKKAPRGKRFSVGVSPDGNPDVLNAIEEMGGIRHPDHVKNPGGEYDGFKETFSKGLARLLIRRTDTASTPDQLLGELVEAGYKFATPDALYAAVGKAIEARAKARKDFNQEEYANAFEKAFLGNEQTRTYLRSGVPITVDDLNVGDAFEVNGEKFKVVDIDEDGNVTIKDGITRTVPPGTVVYPDRGQVDKKKVTTNFLPPPGKPKQQELIPEGDTDLTLQGETMPDAGNLLKDKEDAAKAKAELEANQTKIPGMDDTPRTDLLGNKPAPKPAPAPKPSPPKSKVDELADKLFDGLLGAPVSAKIEQVGFPRDRRQMANDLAESMFDSGIRTPEAMAAYLDQKFNKQARKFSQSLWSTFAFVDPSLASVPNWDEVYAKIDTPAAPAPKPAPKGTLAQRSQNASSAINVLLSEFDTPITWQELFKITDLAFGGTQADGTYTVKDAYDALEGGVNQYILQKLPMPREKSVVAAEDYIQMLQTEILDRIPTQTKRTEEQDRMQQFSTPPHLAFVANWVANLSENDIYLEPSAGVGGLAVFAKSAGVGGVIANELSPRRRAVLEQSDIAEVVLGENAEVLNSILTPKIRTGEMLRPTVVVMNPPFSNAAVSGARGDTTIGAQHIDEAMKLLPPGGRLVAIVGEGMAMGKPTFAGWWRTMQGKYHVRANVHVDGKNYTKYGTSFSNQLLVIDKPRENDVVGLTQPLVAEIDSISQLPSLLEQVRNERIPIQPPKAEPTPPKSGGGGSTSQTKPGVGSGSGSNSSPRTGNVSNGGDGRPSAGSGAARPKSPSAGASRPQAGGVPDAGRPDGGNAAGNGGADSGRAPAEQSTGVVLGDTGNTPVTNIEDGAVFADYAPAKVRVAGAMPHPTPLVESAAMASVPPPDPTYVPNLPAEAVSKSLSDAQLENVIYAGQAHEKLLPDGSRRGYFIGDGTGVGKGRQIAAVILDNWRRGRKRAVWVSKSSNLIEDAKRDMTDVGLDPSLIHSLNKVAKSGKAGISVGDGIVFSTYTTLAKGHNGLDADGNLRVSERKSRLDQLMSWLGKDFDGVIAFDEAHQAGNAVAIRGERGVKKPSNTGIAVVDLQKVFPKARILYVSATGATEVSNLSYAERLGIWGPGTPFRDKLKFIQEISAGGVSAMEIVARDLKSLGSYLARTLSFKGIKFDRVEQALSGDQRDNYNEISRAWQIVFQNMDAAMDISGASNSSEARKNARGAFFGAQQRFFNQLLTAMEMPAVIRDAELQLANGNSVVFQLVNTNESTQDRELARLNEEENPDLEDMDLSPKDILLQYVNNSFPTAKYVEEADPNNPDDTRWVPLKDSEGNIVQDPEAVARKEELLSRISSLQMPANPIELILGKFGVENVAEITGRSSRVVQKADENGVVRRVLERNRTKDVLGVEAKQFQDGERRALIFSGAGGTGFSYHASRKAKNQQLRVHYLVQAGWRADAALQGFGRTHRSDQAQPPLYKLAMTNLQGHRRFVSTIARRLEQLGALTSGDRQTAGQGMFSDKDNLESEYAEMALLTLFRNLYENTVEGFSFDELSRKMGFGQTIEGEWVNALVDPQTGGLNVSKIPTVQQFLNRILALEFDDQNALFDQFMSRMEQAIDVAKERGEFDPGTQTYKALSIEKKSDEVVYQDPNSTAQTRIVEIEAQDPVEFTQFDEIAQLGSSPVERYVRNTTSKRVYALKEGPVRTDEVSGRLVPMFRRIGTHGGIEVLPRADFSTEKYETIPEANARSAWDSEIERADKIKRKKEHFIVGSFLPIWDRIKIASPRIFRFRTTEGEQLLGAVIPPRLLPGVRQRLGAKSGAITPAQAVTNIIEDGQSYNLANEWKVKRVKISGSYRIEVTGPTHLDQNEFRNYIGGFTERIQFDTRFFIPTDREQAVEAMTKLLKKSPIIQDETLLGAPSESSEPAPEKEPLPSSLINKPAPVPDRPGWFFRSEPDSLRALGYSVSQQVHERRSQATANEQALEILSLMDEDKATMLALDPNENGIPGDVKTILYGELMDRQAKIMGNANSTPLQRAKAQRRMQQMNNVKAPIFTERGQEMSALQQVYKNAAGGGIAQYLHHKKKEQEEALGGEKGMADIKAAADELTKVNEQSIEEATRAMNKALRAIPLTKPIWKKYKDWAAQRVFDWLDGITKPPQEMAGLERFTREIVDQVKSRMKEEMGDAAKAQKLPERNPSDILRDAILNKEKYREVFDNVLKKLEAEYGEDHPLVEQAHIALGAMGAKPWSKGTLDKVIKQAHEAMGQNVRELAKLHYTNANRLHRDLADALSDIAGIGATTAKELADDLAKRMQELTAEAKKKAILGIVRRNTATPKTREKMTAIERAVLLNNYGALSVPELADVVAKELKLPHISPEQMKEIARIGDRIETATNMADKAKAELDMLRALRIARGISQMDVNTSIWYANMLSGYTTQVANVIGNMMTGTMQLATIMATNPKYAGEALRGWINGFGEGWAQGAAILKTGRGSREFDANKAGEAGNVLELVDFKRDFPDMNAKWANARQKHTKALRYVTRMMKAVDSVFYYPAREAFARVAVAKLLEGEFKGKELIDKVRETLAISTEQFQAAQKRAKAEGFEGIDLVLRVSNIIEEARRATKVGAEAADASEKFALESTFNNEPVGWAGILYQHLVPLTQSIAPGGVPVLRVFLPFLRVPTNLFNASMNYTPVGAVRALRGMPTEAVRGDDGKFSVKRQDFTADERKRLYAQSIGGSLAMAGLAVLAMSGGDDDEERWFDITSTGPDDYKKRQQLEATGWRPHSIKMGDTWVSYKDSPLLVALAVTGHVVDAIRYGKQDDEVALGSKVANAFLTAPRAIMETSMLSGLGQLMEYASGRASAKQLAAFLTRTATGVAVPNLLQQIDRQFSSEVRESNGPLGTAGASLPFVRRAGDVKTDVLGEAVERNPLSRFGGIESNDPLREVLRDKGVFISTPSRDTKLGNAPMDEETYREYIRISGERIRQRLTQSVRALQAQSKENVERIVDRVIREERERAKNSLRGRAGAN